ncbi:MAG: SAM-dependent methyltransferase, partial [bacterium]
MLRQRLVEIAPLKAEGEQKKFIANLSLGPIAVNTRDANDQHYEVPTEFYLRVLGQNLKYSSGYW